VHAPQGCYPAVGPDAWVATFHFSDTSAFYRIGSSRAAEYNDEVPAEIGLTSEAISVLRRIGVICDAWQQRTAGP
jgi:hypothetical protein